MPRIIKQALAEQDLVDIWLYTFKEWGELRADKYLDELDAAIQLLADQPLICRERAELEPPVRIHLIAYGSDVELAIKTLREIVHAHPRVIDDPEPQIVFESFGDNALMLSARCFLNSLENRWGVVTELNREIYKRFEELDIVIAFPQRDIHFDTDKPIRIDLGSASRKETKS